MPWLREIWTWLKNFPLLSPRGPKVVLASDLQEISDYLRQERQILLAEFRAVGRYFRFDKGALGYLREARNRVLRIAKDGIWKEKNNFLVWSPPGAGKTTYVTELAKEAQDQFALTHKPIDLKHLTTREEIERNIKECSDLLHNGKSLLVSVDEWDRTIGAQQVFDIFHGPLEWNEKEGRKIIWIFIGSGRSKDALVQLINESPKGPDVYRRLGDEPEYHISIPALTAGDKVIIAAAKALELGFARAQATALMVFALDPKLPTSSAIENRVRQISKRPTEPGKLIFRDHFLELDRWAHFYDTHEEILKPLEKGDIDIMVQLH